MMRGGGRFKTKSEEEKVIDLFIFANKVVKSIIPGNNLLMREKHSGNR